MNYIDKITADAYILKEINKVLDKNLTLFILMIYNYVTLSWPISSRVC